MNKYQELVFRKNPRYICILTIILIVLLSSFILISCFYKYNKYYYLTGLQNKEGGNNYVSVLLPYNKMDIIKNNVIIIDKKKQNFTYEIMSGYYNDTNKLYKEVKLFVDTCNEHGDLVELIFESQKTTFIEEIKNKIKKGMIF